jgi:hypothetical protein
MKDGSGIAVEGLHRIVQVYKFEAIFRGSAPEECVAIRQENSVPLIADFRP